MSKKVVLYEDGLNLPISGDADGDVLAWNADTSSWESTSPTAGGTVTSVATGTGLTGGPITTSGTISADFGTSSGKVAEGNDARFNVAPSAGDGRLALTVSGAWSSLAAGSANMVLRSNGTTPAWGAVNLATDVTGTLALASVAGPATASAFGYTAASGVWNSTGIAGTDKLVGFNGSTPAAISIGTGLSLSSGTISLASLSPSPSGSFGSASSVAAITVDGYGRVTAASSTSIAIAASAITSGTLAIANGGTGLSSAGGVANRVVLTTDGSAFSVGTVPNTALANSSLTVTAGTGLSGGGSVALGSSTTLSLPNVGTAATYGSASSVPVITTDAQGRVSSVTNTSIAISASAVSAIPYDFGGSASGTPTAGADIFRFVFVRAASILASGSRCNCKTAPSGGSPSFDLKLNGASIGSIAFTDGNTTGTVTITSGPVAVAAGDTVVVTAPAALYSISDPCWTIAANVA